MWMSLKSYMRRCTDNNDNCRVALGQKWPQKQYVVSICEYTVSNKGPAGLAVSLAVMLILFMTCTDMYVTLKTLIILG